MLSIPSLLGKFIFGHFKEHLFFAPLLTIPTTLRNIYFLVLHHAFLWKVAKIKTYYDPYLRYASQNTDFREKKKGPRLYSKNSFFTCWTHFYAENLINSNVT